jgi:hypothetical protein
MAGLLNFFEGMDKKTQMGLLMAGAQMMQTQRGDSPFAAIGNGLLGFANGMLNQEQQAKEDARLARTDARQSRLDDVDMQLKQAQAQRYLSDGTKQPDPYYTPIPTPNGVYGFDNRSGKVQLAIDENGQPVIKSSDSVELQSNLAAGRKRGETMNSIVDVPDPDSPTPTKMLGGAAFPELKQPSQPLPQRPTDLSKLPQKVLQDGQYHDLADYIPIAQQFVPNVMQVESGGNPNAVSPVNAKGLMQIMDKTGAAPGMNVIPLQNKSNAENVRFGTDYLAGLLKENNGDVARALSAYNQGQGNLNKKGITNPDYVNNVFNAKPSQQVIDLSNPITKPAVAGMQLAAKNGVSPQEAIDKGVAIAEQSVSDLKQVQGAAHSMYKGQSTKDKLALETDAKRRQAENEAAIKLQTEPKITAANADAKTNAEFSAGYRQDNESGNTMINRIDELMKYLYPDGKPIYDKNGDMIPPKEKMIFDNAPFDRAKFLAHNKGFGTFDQGTNLNSLVKAAKQVTLDNLNGKLGAGIATADLNFINDLTGVNEDNLKPSNDIYRAVGQWRKNAIQKSTKGQPTQQPQVSHIDNLLDKYK